MIHANLRSIRNVCSQENPKKIAKWTGFHTTIIFQQNFYEERLLNQLTEN